MNNLIAKLEAAPEGSRELDAEIAGLVLDGVIELSADNLSANQRYTRSVDAALRLVPEGWHVDCLTTGDKSTKPENPSHWPQCIIRPNLDNDAAWAAVGVRECRKANTPAIAICIAALKAMQMETNDANK